ncbi:MAG TPA: acetate--CoA ligase family protein [Candidatus Dojkabacteria bacterium]|nr:acetate--CoA ligase family protein [Candidatus Dojkabacteria bacterium]HQF36552.1 acetate--CoA ligase family protein [Candidatus Dojkabacteria bacterium]
MADNLNSLFDPKSVAIVGVSNQPDKIGSVIYKNLLSANYQGRIYLVNPKYGTLYGKQSYKSLKNIRGKVELVCICIPAPFVFNVVKECVSIKVKNIIIISAGFKETGKEGAELEKKIVTLANKNGIRILGPNCLGMIASKTKVNLSFAQGTPKDGNIAFLSQSGAFCTAILDIALKDKLGFSHFVSIGNKADINEIELFENWLKDDSVNVIGAYLEEIEQGNRLINLYNQHLQNSDSSKVKPIVLVKAGKSEQAQKAITSHTGSMAGNYEGIAVSLKQNGIIEVQSSKDLYNVMKFFSWMKPVKGKRVAIVTNAGGLGIITTDELVKQGFEIAELTNKTISTLKSFLPPASSIGNTIDILGDANGERYEKAIRTVGKDKNVDSIIVLLTPQFVTEIDETAKAIVDISKTSNIPIIPIFFIRESMFEIFEYFNHHKIMSFDDVTEAVTTMKFVLDYEKRLKDLSQSHTQELGLNTPPQNRNMFLKHIQKIKQTPHIKTLPNDFTEKLAKEVGLNLAPQKICNSTKEAIEFAQEHYPVVIKAPNELIPHKTDYKALYVNIRNNEELLKNFELLMKNLIRHTKVKSPYILVQKQLKYEEEFFIGAVRNGASDVYKTGKGWGHLLVFGKGGIYTEIFNDTGKASVVASKKAITSALMATKTYKILQGARGKSPLPIKKVINAILAVQRLVWMYPEIESIDINPLLVNENEVFAVDIKIFV